MRTLALLLFFLPMITLAQTPQAGELVLIHQVADLAAMNSISGLEIGSLIYNIAEGKLYVYNGANWAAVGEVKEWKTAGNSGTNAATDFLGTTDNQALILKTNNSNRIEVGNTGDIKLNDYPKTRDDSGSEAVTNILYTDANGTVLSAPAAKAFGLVVVETKTSNYTLTLADQNKIIEFNSTTNVTCTIPATLPIGFQVSISQLGTGRVQFVGGATVRNAYNSFRTARRYSKAGVEIASTGEAIISGDVAK